MIGEEPLRWIRPGVSALNHCLFLDRDGVINERVVDGHVTAWETFQWIPGTTNALRKTVEQVNLPLVVVTNQSCIGRGTASAETVIDILDRMRLVLEATGIVLSAWYCCPHLAEDGCACRKPLPGMLHTCARDLGVRLAESYLIGDSVSDVQAGESAGCASWLVNGEWDLTAALEAVVERERARSEQKTC